MREVQMQRRHRDVVFRRARGSFFSRLLHARTLRAQHVERDEQQHDAAGDLKRRQVDAEKLQDAMAEQRERKVLGTLR